MEITGSVPLLVGRGEPPLVWLSASRKNGFAPVVAASESLLSNVTASNVFGGTVIMSEGKVLLSARNISEGEVDVDQLDLRPLGLNIHGDKTGLRIGSNNLSNNHFSGADVMVAIGE